MSGEPRWSNYTVISSLVGAVRHVSVLGVSNWPTKIDEDPQGIAIKPGTPSTSIVAPPANHATPTRSLEATDSSLNVPFDEKVAFMACPRHAADRQAVVVKRATF